MRETSWQQVDASRLIQRLQDAQALLAEAAIVAAADDGARLSAMAELQRRLEEERHVDQDRRRYR